MYFIKNYEMKGIFFFLACACCLLGCEGNSSYPDEKVRERATAFAGAYFNYDFTSARKLVTEESVKWLEFAASNVTQEDVDLYNSVEEPATVEIDDYQYVNDTISIVTVLVENYLQKDSINRTATISDQGTFRLTLVLRDGKYYVRMEGPLRSERQSRD